MTLPAGDFLPIADRSLDPGLQKIKQIVLDGLRSQHSKDSYDRSLTDFLSWYQIHAAGEGFTKATVQRWVEKLRQEGLSSSTINVRLSAVRKLALEAADADAIPENVAQSIKRVKGDKKLGVRTGNWLTPRQAEELANVPDTRTLKGKRDRAIVVLFLGGALRRAELSNLKFEDIQQREGRWVIVDLKGKGGRLRTVPIPSWAKAAIDLWTSAAQISDGFVFRAMNNKGQILANRLLPQNIMELVVKYGQQIGVKLAPHDLRRTCAKLAEKGGARLQQIQFMLGHASLMTTEKYLGSQQDLGDAPCDHLGLNLSGGRVPHSLSV